MTVWRRSVLSHRAPTELNLEKMAVSDQRIVSVGKEGNYIIDLMSMSKDEPKKKKGKK